MANASRLYLEYRAPELWDGAPARVASDLYALGCVAFELLTGQKAFPGLDFAEQHRTRVPVLPIGTDPALAALIMDLLAKAPGARPQDARTIVDILSPRGPITAGQRGLQQIKLRSVLRREERSSADAQLVELQRRQQAARANFNSLWRQVGEIARDAVGDAESREDLNGNPMLVIGDSRMRMEFAPPPTVHQFPDLVFVGEVIADVGGSGGRESQSIANLVCCWKDDAPQWQVVQFLDEASPRGVTAVHVTQLAALWPSISQNPQHENLRTNEPFSPARLIDLFVNGHGIEVEAAPSDS